MLSEFLGEVSRSRKIKSKGKKSILDKKILTLTLNVNIPIWREDFLRNIRHSEILILFQSKWWLTIQCPQSNWQRMPPVQGRYIYTQTWKYISVTQSCLTLCNTMDCSPPGSSVHGISQARIWEWIANSFSRGSSLTRDWTCISCAFCIAGWFFTHWATEKSIYASIHTHTHTHTYVYIYMYTYLDLMINNCIVNKL